MTNFNATSFAVPQHPLPEEIQQMKRDETVCKFCGVSYLIHNEMKALQEKLAEAERQMEFYKGSVEREKQLKEKIGTMDGELLKQSQKLKDQEQQLELFKSDLKMKANLINDMYSQKRKYESSIKGEQSKSDELSAHNFYLSSTLQKYKTFIKEQKESLNSLKKDVCEHKVLSNEAVLYIGARVKKASETLHKKIMKEKQATEMKWKMLTEQLMNFQKEVDRLHGADTKLTDLQTKYIEQKQKVDVYEKHVNQLEEVNTTLKEKNKTIENGLIQKSKEARDAMNNLETIKKEKQEENFKSKELLMQKDEELKKSKDLCVSLEKLMNEISAAEKKVQEKVTDKDEQLENLKETVSNLRTESGKLKIEREQTIVAHHNRIEQLRESYTKKLEASEKTCSVLQKELDEMKRKVEVDVEGSHRILNEECHKEISALNSKHLEEVRIMELEIKRLNEKLEQETNICRGHKEEINQLKNSLSTTKTRNAQETQKYQNEILNLKKNVEMLQLKSEGDHKETGTKSRYEAIQKSLHDTKTQIKVMEQQLITKNNELTTLKDTVRRECEERLELTQALSDTRIQLLSLQQNPEVAGPFPCNRRLYKPAVNNFNRKSPVNPVVSSANVDMTSSETSEVIASRVRRIKSTGSKGATRESVDSFRERIAAALGRESRFNHTR